MLKLKINKETVEAKTPKKNIIVKPFIRWAGGKQNLIDEIFKYVNVEEVNRYFEPFLGGGSFFLKGDFSSAILSDLNPNLINCYQQIKDNPEEVFEGLCQYKIPVTKEEYYRVRSLYNSNNGNSSVEQAIRFIFLNKTSFNGIYRVNNSGEYNVPFGKEKPSLPSLDQLRLVSRKLQNANLFCGFYDEIEEMVREGDLVYLDPPYPKLSETSYFNHYTLEKFDEAEQEKLSLFANKLSRKGCNVIISNADLIRIRDLYKGWYINGCSTFRYISCKKERVKIKELIITNYKNERA